jgi:hypothetical protein
MESQVGMLFLEIRQNITVFFLGDHDPSGHVIDHNTHRRAQAASGVDFRMVRLIAIHDEDIAAFRLPPKSIKTTDSRAASFRRRFGDNAATVELDALPVAELRRRVNPARGRTGGPNALGSPTHDAAGRTELHRGGCGAHEVAAPVGWAVMDIVYMGAGSPNLRAWAAIIIVRNKIAVETLFDLEAA